MVHANIAFVLAIAAINAGSTFATPVVADEKARDNDESLVLSRDGLANVDVRSTIPAPAAASMWKTAAKTFGPALVGGVVGPVVAKVLDKISPNKERDVEETILQRSEMKDIFSRAFELELESRYYPSGMPGAEGLASPGFPRINPPVVGNTVARDAADTVFERSDIETLFSRGGEDGLEARQPGWASVAKSALKNYGPPLAAAVIAPIATKLIDKFGRREPSGELSSRSSDHEIILVRAEIERMLSRAVQQDLAAQRRSEEQDIFSRYNYASIEDLD